MANHKLTKDKIFRRFQEKHGNKYKYAVFEYDGIFMKIDIFCPQHGWFRQKISDHIKGSGCPQCSIESHREQMVLPTRYKVCVYDVGNINEMTPIVRKAYKFWRAMTQRCYDPLFLAKHPTYATCEVCDAWKSFSGFVGWFASNYIEGYELDKDILSDKNNKIYSPDTCCFIPHEINTIINRRCASRRELPIGVRKSKTKGKFDAHMRQRMKEIKIGTFDTPMDAFFAYKKEKEAYVKKIAQEYYNKGKIDNRVHDALTNYKVEITD